MYNVSRLTWTPWWTKGQLILSERRRTKTILTLGGLCIICCNIYTFQRDTQCSSTDCLLMLRCQLYMFRTVTVLLHCVSRWNVCVCVCVCVYIYIYILQKMINGPSNVKCRVPTSYSTGQTERISEYPGEVCTMGLKTGMYLFSHRSYDQPINFVVRPWGQHGRRNIHRNRFILRK